MLTLKKYPLLSQAAVKKTLTQEQYNEIVRSAMDWVQNINPYSLSDFDSTKYFLPIPINFSKDDSANFLYVAKDNPIISFGKFLYRKHEINVLQLNVGINEDDVTRLEYILPKSEPSTRRLMKLDCCAKSYADAYNINIVFQVCFNKRNPPIQGAFPDWGEYWRRIKLCREYFEQERIATINTKNYWKSEMILYCHLKALFPDTIRQKKLDEKRELYFDIFIPSLNVAVEYQGIQHYENIGKYDKNSLEKRKELDEEKRNICQKMGVTLVEWEYKTDICFENVVAMFSNSIGLIIDVDKTLANNSKKYSETKLSDYFDIF